MRLTYWPRAEFLNGGFDYEPGEHVVFIEPTQQGKTHLAYQMLDSAMNQHPELRVASLMPKSRDPATRRWAAQLQMEIIGSWPPPARWPWQDKPRGYICWPKHLKAPPGQVDPDFVRRNREHLAAILRTAMHGQFDQGDSITLIDDAILMAILGLMPEIEEHLSAGAGGGAGAWVANQKSTGTKHAALTTLARNMPQHVILGHDPMKENRQQFADIGGVDPGLVANIVAGLKKHRIKTPAGYRNISEKLYIRKDGPYMAIIGV